MPAVDRETLSKAILDFLAQPNAICFAGAGVSAIANLPDWRRFLDHLVSVAHDHEPETAALMRTRIAANRLVDAAHYYKQCNMPVGKMYEKLASPFLRGQYDPAPLKPLARLPFTAFVTTNYDMSLHDAWASVHSLAPTTAELGSATMRTVIHAREPYIARIHGMAEDPYSMIVDADDYRRLQDDPYYPDFLFHLLSTQRCLFIGFSFVDPSIERVLHFLEDKLGPTYPQLHLALLPENATELADRLRTFNIDTVHYKTDSDRHEEIWAAISLAAKVASASRLEANYSRFPAALEGARQLLVSAYVHSRVRHVIGPLRDHIIQGLLLAIINHAGPAGLSHEELVARVKPLLPLSLPEATKIVDDHLPELLKNNHCSQSDGRYTCDIDQQSLDTDLDILVDGVLSRLAVREGITLDNGSHDLVRAVLDDVILMRGWDLGAHFAGAAIPQVTNLWTVLSDAVIRHAPKLAQAKAAGLAAVTYDLLTRPDGPEAEVLVTVGRLAFAVDVVLQHGRSVLLHSHTLPERIYLDASFVMPAIVNGHPYRPTYLESIHRWREATNAAGMSHHLLVAVQFLSEIVAHRALGIKLIEKLNLEDPETLRKHILFYGADYTNVFVGAYASWVDRVAKSPPSFSEWLDQQAPYDSVPQLAHYLRERGFEIVALSQDSDTYYPALRALSTAYDQDPSPDKTPLLIRHEAAQLARLIDDLRGGQPSVFVTADKRLRRLAVGRLLGTAGAAIISHLGLIQLVDFLVGLQPEATSLARLMWGIKFLEEHASARTTLRSYFTDMALKEQEATTALALPQILDRIVDEAEAAALDEELNLVAQRDQALVARFLDRFQDRFHSYLLVAMDKERTEDR